MAVFDIIGTATTAANNVAKKLSETSLAKDLSGLKPPSEAQLQAATKNIAGQVKDLVKDPLGAFNVDISKLLSAPSMTGATLSSDGLPPYPNPLGIFASYTYIFTLSVLTDNAVANPESTYRAGIPQRIICKSAAGDPTNRVETAYGKFDFFIDNVQMESIVGWSKATKNTSATSINFQITEPYSMGLFMQSLSLACQEVGPNQTYITTPLLLTIQFRGFTEQNETVDLPQFTRYQPIKIKAINMKVTGKGAVYDVETNPHNDTAFSDKYKNLKNNISIRGRTVQEILQTGEKSLQAVMNQFYQSQVKDGLINVPDQIAIVFPKDIATSTTQSNVTQKENKTTATTNPKTAAANMTLFQKLGVTESSTKNLIQAPESCNALGAASLGFNSERKGDASFAKESGAFDPTTQTYTLGNVAIDVSSGEFKFAQDTDVVNAINQVLLQSDYARQAIKPAQIDSNGMLPWWRIETQLYQLQTDANMSKNGTKPSLVVYRIVPYKVHSSKVMPPNTPAPGLENLRRQCIKEYNYIYTGKNLDILDFSLQTNAAYFQKVAATNINNTIDVKQQANDSGKDANDSSISIPEGEKTTVTGSPGSRTIAVGTSTSTDRLGGGGPETAATRMARQAHDAFLESYDMTTCELKILGDPYYISDSGVGNYTAQTIKDYQNLNADGAMDYQSSEVHIILNFRTPVDFNERTGMYDFGSTELLTSYSGLFKVNRVTHTFQNNKFTQVLHLQRIGMQEAALANKERANNTASKLASAEPVPTPDITTTNANFLNAILNKNNNVNPTIKTPALPGVVNSGGVQI